MAFKLLAVLHLCSLISRSLAISCYQCSGTDNKSPFQCNEYLGSDHDLSPDACDDVYDARYCIKHTGRFEGGIGTKRFCSSLDLGNYCNNVKQPGDHLTYRTCIYTCTGDGCNSGSGISSLIVLNLVSLMVVYLTYLKIR